MANKKCTKSNIPSKEEEILIANMKKHIQLISAQLQRLKEEYDTSLKKFSLQDYLPFSNDKKWSTSYNVEPSHLKKIHKHPRNLEIFLKKKLGNLNQSVISPLWEDLMNQLWKNFFKRNSLYYLRSLWLESSFWVIIVPIIDIIYMKLHIVWSWKIKSKISLIMA